MKIAVMAFEKDKVFNVFENSMSLQLVALCQDCHPSEINSEVVIVYKIPDAKKNRLGEVNLCIETGKLMWSLVSRLPFVGSCSATLPPSG